MYQPNPDFREPQTYSRDRSGRVGFNETLDITLPDPQVQHFHTKYWAGSKSTCSLVS
jgi:hypothetical protein